MYSSLGKFKLDDKVWVTVFMTCCVCACLDAVRRERTIGIIDLLKLFLSSVSLEVSVEHLFSPTHQLSLRRE